MAELAEGARLLSECGGKLPPRVRIPVSPPSTRIKARCNNAKNLRVIQRAFLIDAGERS